MAAVARVAPMALRALLHNHGGPAFALGQDDIRTMKVAHQSKLKGLPQIDEVRSADLGRVRTEPNQHVQTFVPVQCKCKSLNP